jgi:predicted RNase H-like nuclease (RuvC/YqgF family)
MKESASDFSIVKSYVELKTKYDSEMRALAETTSAQEGKYKSHIAMLESEISKRNDYIKAQEAKVQELTQKITEKDEQIRNLGGQLNKIKMGGGGADSPPGGSEDPKKSKFGIFK